MRTMLAVLLALAAAGRAGAHIGDRIYLIPELTDAQTATVDLRDGSVADWRALLGEPALTAQDFYAHPGVGDGAPYDPADLDYSIWLGWNRTGGQVWCALERKDDVYIAPGPGVQPRDFWQYDSVEFMLDGDQSGGNYYNGPEGYPWMPAEQELQMERTAQQYLVVADAADDPKVGTIGSGTWATVPPFADAGGASSGSAPTTTISEFYVTPFDNLLWNDAEGSLASPLYPGKVIGLQITVPDFDSSPGQYHAYHILSGQDATWQFADRFVDARLISEESPAEPPPPRLAVNWPNGGEAIGTDRGCRVQWYADPAVEQVKIELSTDDGASWEVLTEATVNDGVYEWLVLPGQVTSQARIRISDLDGDPTDTSRLPFTIFRSTPDLDADGSVGFDDFFILAERFWSDEVEANLDGNGIVEYPDLFVFADNFGRTVEQVVIPYPAWPGPGPYANAGVTFSLECPVSQVESGQEFEVTINAAGLVGMRQFQVSLWDVNGCLDWSGTSFTMGVPGALGGFTSGEPRAGGFVLSPVSGDATLGTFTLRAASWINPGTQIELRFTWATIGTSVVETDVFGEETINRSLMLNTVPQIRAESVWHTRQALLAGEGANLYASFPAGVSVTAVQALVRPEGADQPAAIVSLADDGTAPDDAAGDNTYSAHWAGTGETGFYWVDLEYHDGTETRRQNQVDAFRVSHTILSIPSPMLAGLGQQVLQIPLLVEDDGQGFLSREFLAAQLGVDVWTYGPVVPERPGLTFAGTSLGDQQFLLDTTAVRLFDEGSDQVWYWRLRAGLANASPLRLRPGTGPGQQVLAYLSVPVNTFYEPDGLVLSGLNGMFDEEVNATDAVSYSWVYMARGDVDTSRAIDSFDASLVLMHMVHKINLDQAEDSLNDLVESTYGFAVPDFAPTMADVSGQKGITAFDASLILRRDVGMISHFPCEEGYYRLWEPPTEWWSPPPAKPVKPTAPMLARSVWLGAPAPGDDGLVSAPVLIDRMDQILAGTLSLSYPPSAWEPAGARQTELTAGYLVADHAGEGTLRVSFAGATAPTGSGALLELRFRPRATGGTDPLPAVLTEVRLNEGEVAVQLEGVTAGQALPHQVTLHANYPNPFNPRTTLRYELPAAEQVRLSVYNLSGQRVRVLVDDRRAAGRYAVAWDGRDSAGAPAASGVYLCRLEAGRAVLLQKMLLVK